MSYPVGDCYGPFCQVTIIHGEERIPLWMNHQTDSTREDLPIVNSVSVKTQLSGVPIISVKLCPPIDVGRRFLSTDLIDWGGEPQLEVILGYARGPRGTPVFTPPYRGVILKPDVTIGADIQITLHAQGMNTSPLTTSSGRTLTGTIREIVLQLLRGYDPDNPRRSELNDDEVYRASDDLKRAYFNEVTEITCGQRPDWMVIHDLLWQIGCWMLWHNDGLRVIPRTLRLADPPKYILACYDFPQGVLGSGDPPVLPIKSASSPSMGVYLPAGVLGQFQAGTSPQTRQTTTRTTDDRTATPSRTGPGAVGPAPSPNAPAPAADGSGLEFAPGTPADQLAQNQARAEHAAMQSQAGKKLNVDTIGVIDLFPGDIMAVAGLGKHLDQNYAILKLEHSLDVGGFVTKLEMVSNVNTLVEAAAARRVLGPTNRHRPRVGWTAEDGRQFLAETAPQPRTQPRTQSSTARARTAPAAPTPPGRLADSEYNDLIAGLRGL